MSASFSDITSGTRGLHRHNIAHFGKKNPYDMGKTHIIRIFFLESDSGNHDLISQNPLIHILIFLNIQNL